MVCVLTDCLRTVFAMSYMSVQLPTGVLAPSTTVHAEPAIGEIEYTHLNKNINTTVT